MPHPEINPFLFIAFAGVNQWFYPSMLMWG